MWVLEITGTKRIDIHPIQYLKGVGPQLALKFHKLGIETVEDLLLHLPRRYQDRTRITPIQTLNIATEAVIQGQVRWVEKTTKHKHTQCLVCVSDGTAEIWLRFFHVYGNFENKFKIGVLLRAFGEIRFYQHRKEMAHPEYQILPNSTVPVEDHLTPVYPTTEGLSQKKIRQCIVKALGLLEHEESSLEYLPESILPQTTPFLKWKDAIRYLHTPPPDANQNMHNPSEHPAFLRLVLEELIAHTACLLQLREERKKFLGFVLPVTYLRKTFLDSLPFALTAAQQRVLADVDHDLKQPVATARLIQGDVGCGKTVIAALALLQAVENAYQAALLVPTELLAEQHYQTLCRWFQPLRIMVYLLCHKISERDRKSILDVLQTGEPVIVVGTHALFQTEVEFKKLALIVVDEQHRFGVEQRLQLFNKGKVGLYAPHQLLLTATPIPRTLAMAAYADLDHSVIDALPPGRVCITTVAVPETRREEVITRIRTILAKKQQIYWVCALIDASEVLSCQAAGMTFSYLQQMLPDVNIGFIHGRMKAPEKDAVMRGFQEGHYAILVATTVVEVGVDVQNATLMVIENTERMGLAAIHQLRGRVGRGLQAGYCILLYRGPLSDIAKQRLDIIRRSQDGFVIAEKDLQLRGPGEVLGVEQSGMAVYRVAEFALHQQLFSEAEQCAQVLLREYPTQIALLSRRWLPAQGIFVA